MQDVLDVLHGINVHFESCVGDYSRRGGKAMRQAGDALAYARARFSAARHHLSLDNPTEETALGGFDRCDGLAGQCGDG